MHRYILIAGVNGAGKSTLFHLLRDIQDIPRINTDEIVREIGDWKNPSDVMKAGRIAVKRLEQLLEDKISFNQETTLCGQTILRNICRAKECGYHIELHYVGLASAELAKERIASRVKNGGHGIPEHDVDRRYGASLENLKIVLPQCDLVAFYDNTEAFRRFAIYKHGKLAVISKDVPEWFRENVLTATGKQKVDI